MSMSFEGLPSRAAQTPNPHASRAEFYRLVNQLNIGVRT